jgi:hypothetical protein
MGRRSHTSFKKRQKEIARVEKQREKAARRMQRKRTDGQTETPDIATQPGVTNLPDAPSGAPES